MSDNNGYDNDVVEDNIDYFVTQSTIKKSAGVERIIEILRLRKTTGDLCFHFQEGGIRRIELNERTKIADEDAADQIREILDMD